MTDVVFCPPSGEFSHIYIGVSGGFLATLALPKALKAAVFLTFAPPGFV